jgi:hypothetical protein
MADLFMMVLAHMLQRMERVRHKGNTAGNF